MGWVMADYLLYVVILDCMVILCMINLIYQNKLLESFQRRGFITAFGLVGFLSIVELLGVYVDKVEGFRWANMTLNIIFFILAPVVPISFGNSLRSYKRSNRNIELVFYAIYLILIFISIPFDFIFGVTPDNVYFRGKGFMIFAVLYEVVKLYMVYSSFIMIKKFQNRNWFTIILLVLFFIVGSSIQIFRPDVHTSWSCTTLIAIVYYVYFNELWSQLDGMTGLFSHKSYLARAVSLRPGEGIIIMDCDEFKLLNDTYGHSMGDKCIMTVAKCIKDVYNQHGICYRIGGDEFAIILFNTNDNDILIKKFISLIEKERMENELLPHISIGFAKYSGFEDVNEIKDMADKNMYFNKDQRKRILKEENRT